MSSVETTSGPGDQGNYKCTDGGEGSWGEPCSADIIVDGHYYEP
jgi:hypothetical protein